MSSPGVGAWCSTWSRPSMCLKLLGHPSGSDVGCICGALGSDNPTGLDDPAPPCRRPVLYIEDTHLVDERALLLLGLGHEHHGDHVLLDVIGDRVLSLFPEAVLDDPVRSSWAVHPSQSIACAATSRMASMLVKRTTVPRFLALRHRTTTASPRGPMACLQKRRSRARCFPAHLA